MKVPGCQGLGFPKQLGKRSSCVSSPFLYWVIILWNRYVTMLQPFVLVYLLNHCLSEIVCFHCLFFGCSIVLVFYLPLFMFLRFHLQAHIRTFGGRIAETILSLRFFIFQYGIVYKLNVKGDSTSLTVIVYFILIWAFLPIPSKCILFSYACNCCTLLSIPGSAISGSVYKLMRLIFSDPSCIFLP